MTQIPTETVPLPASSSPLRFLRGFLACPRQVASIVPSSRRLQRSISSLPCVRSAESIIELGPGTGETTRALLSEMPNSGRLLCVEIVSEFVDLLHEIGDARLSVAHGSAQQIDHHLMSHAFPTPDVVVSGVPFSTMSRGEGRALVEMINAALKPGGIFVAYQLRDRISELASDLFGPPQTSFVLWNLPPLRVYQWKKPSVETGSEGVVRCTPDWTIKSRGSRGAAKEPAGPSLCSPRSASRKLPPRTR